MAPKSSTASHPTYEEMIKEAIVTLKEKTGSSQFAIAKFIEEKHKNLSPNFKKLLLQALKKNVASGKLVKVKGSFKLSPATKASEPKTKPAVVKPKTKPAAKVTAVKAKPAAKPKAKTVVKPKVVSKAKAVTAKPKPAAAKPKAAAAKPKAAAAKPKPKASVKPAKAARTSTRTMPGKKVAAAKAVVKKAVAAKKTPVKSKSVKSPAKKVSTKRGGRK